MEVDRKSATLLYRAAQELLSNVHKFANASAVTIRLGCLSHPALCHEVQLKVTDDGAGFDAEGGNPGQAFRDGAAAHATRRGNSRRPHEGRLVPGGNVRERHTAAGLGARYWPGFR